jgi:hypothetical protein
MNSDFGGLWNGMCIYREKKEKEKEEEDKAME